MWFMSLTFMLYCYCFVIFCTCVQINVFSFYSFLFLHSLTTCFTIVDAESKLELFQKEKQYLENQLSITHKSIFEKDGQEIVEVLTEEEDQAWRQKHRENVRKYKQGKAKEEKPKEEITDEELWNRLEELELEEELESELLDNYNEIVDKRKENNFLIKEEQKLLNSCTKEEKDNNDTEINNDNVHQLSDKHTVIGEKIKCLKDKKKKEEENESMSKVQLLQQVLDKQNQLEEKLLQIKNRDRQPSKSEQDLMSRLDEMEQLEELEDDMERLDDILETEDVDSDEDDDNVNSDNTSSPVKLKKGISFADHIEHTGKTIEVTYKHSNVEPCKDPYDHDKGIVKPSDIYEAHSSLFKSKPSSILKKSNYDNDNIKDTTPKQANINLKSSDIEGDSVSDSELEEKEIIVVKDVVENSGGNRSKINTDARPTSLFKQRRMQNKN